jgi:hypothetical protein
MALTTPAMTLTTLTTRRPLPRYKGRVIDNTDLIEAIDQVGYKLTQTLTLVDLIQNQSTEQVLPNHNRSTRPVWARRPTRLDTDLVVTATPKGVRLLRPHAKGVRRGRRYAVCEASIAHQFLL